jgi:hypothetical protein
MSLSIRNERPHNMPLNPTMGPVTLVAARDQDGRSQDSGATTAPVRPRGLSAIRYTDMCPYGG